MNRPTTLASALWLAMAATAHAETSADAAGAPSNEFQRVQVTATRGERASVSYTHLDVYKRQVYAQGEAEKVMGDVIADLRLPRDGYCVSSKVYFGAAKNPLPTQRGLSRKHVAEACHAALKRLRVEHLDLYFCHRPDPDTPIEETVWAMDALIRQGKVLYWGTSEWSAAQIKDCLLYTSRCV